MGGGEAKDNPAATEHFAAREAVDGPYFPPYINRARSYDVDYINACLLWNRGSAPAVRRKLGRKSCGDVFTGNCPPPTRGPDPLPSYTHVSSHIRGLRPRSSRAAPGVGQGLPPPHRLCRSG